MRIWFDTEFIEDGETIQLISIGMVREDGKTFYAEFYFDKNKANDWVKKNVLPRLTDIARNRFTIREDITEFAGDKPEFWAYYGAYDWVALCQLYGSMMELPSGWPMYCRDVKQLCDDLGNPSLPKQSAMAHNALHDAIWTRQAWEFLKGLKK